MMKNKVVGIEHEQFKNIKQIHFRHYTQWKR